MKVPPRYDAAKLIPAVFFRDSGFYVVDIMPGTAAEHAALNPGTIKVEDVVGNILWESHP